MDTKKLEELLEAGRETQTLEFKKSCDWNIKCFAKDILAFSNVSDGGHIVIGMEENSDDSYSRTGVTIEHSKTFKSDNMKDQMNAFADPHVDFSVHLIKDKNGTDFVVIRVYPFEEIPVICSKDSSDTKSGILYYRNRNRRPESAPVSNANDMRAIVRQAAQRLMQKLREEGFSAITSKSINDVLDEEIRDL